MNVAQVEHAAVPALDIATYVEQDVQIPMEDFIVRAKQATVCKDAQCVQVGLTLGI